MRKSPKFSARAFGARELRFFSVGMRAKNEWLFSGWFWCMLNSAWGSHVLSTYQDINYSQVLRMKIARVFLLAPLALANKNSFQSRKRAENERFFSGWPCCISISVMFRTFWVRSRAFFRAVWNPQDFCLRLWVSQTEIRFFGRDARQKWAIFSW